MPLQSVWRTSNVPFRSHVCPDLKLMAQFLRDIRPIIADLALLVGGCAGQQRAAEEIQASWWGCRWRHHYCARCGQQQHKIVLRIYRCAGKAQPFGQAAKRHLADKVVRQQVASMFVERDKYGRTLVWVAGRSGRQSGARVPRVRLAHYQYYARKTQPVTNLTATPMPSSRRNSGLGLWRGSKPRSAGRFPPRENAHSGGYRSGDEQAGWGPAGDRIEPLMQPATGSGTLRLLFLYFATFVGAFSPYWDCICQSLQFYCLANPAF